MKVNKIILSIIALGLMASCQKEELFNADLQVADKVEVSATLADASQTRTQHSTDHTKVLWSENDALSVFTIGDELCHDRYYLTSGAGVASAKFQWDKTYNGVITGGIEVEGAKTDSYVAVYPFMEETSVKVVDDSYVINTVIPTNQKYAENSFGQGAFVMVGVDMVNAKPAIPFKNIGTILIFPLKGEGTIQSATLKSEKSKIAGKAVVTVSAENNFIPSTEVSNGESEITLSCGEGVQLNVEEYTNFCFVLAPGVYEDLVIKFTDTYGNYFEQKIENPNRKEMARSMSYNMPKMTFEATGTEQVDLWVKAQASAYMTAERIIPSVDNLNVEAWVKALMNQPDTKDRLEQAVTYLSLGQYDLVYDVLGGVPGFIKDLKRYDATGTYIQKVDYTGASYLKSFIEGVEKINDIKSLLAFMNEFEKVYEASGLKNQLDASLGSIADNFDKYIDAFVDANYEKPEQDNTLTEEEAFAQYKANIKEQLESSLDGWDNVIYGIQVARNGIKVGKYTILEADENFGKDKETGYDAIESIETYIEQANALLVELETLNDKNMIESKIMDLNPIVIKLKKYYTVPDLGWLGNTSLSLIGLKPGEEIKVIDEDRTIDPSSFLTGADSDYEKYMENLKNQILGNEQLINAAKAYVKSEIEKIQGTSIVESLETAVNEPDSWTGKVLNYLFSQETFLESVKKSLRDIVAGIEEDKKEEIDNGNVDLKMQAIKSSKDNALLYARAEAIKSIEKQLAATNEANLNGGPWGVFKKVLNWEKCVELFTECGILDVYNVLCDFAALVDKIYTFNRTTIYYDIENFEDYQENVDWWLLTYSEDFE